MFSGTNLENLKNIAAFIHLHVLMNADMNHNDAKKFITEGYAIDRPDTLDQWVIWILEFVHVEVWSKHQTLGTELSKWVAIDESFWQRGGVDKNMAPHSAVAFREPTWI